MNSQISGRGRQPISSQFTTQSNASTKVPPENVAEPKAKWDTNLTEAFIRLCVSETTNDNRPGGSFNKQGWLRLITRFQQATGLTYSKTQLKNKWDTMKKDWGIWKSLLNEETGLGWDNKKGTIDATPEWWAKKLKATPQASKYRTRGPILLDEQESLFTDVVANGKNSWTPSCGVLPEYMCEENLDEVEEEQTEFEPDNITPTDPSNLEGDPMFAGTQSQGIPTQNKKSKSIPSLNRMRTKRSTKKLTSAQQVVRCLQTMADKIEMVNAKECACTNKPGSGSIDECLELLDNMIGVVAGGKLWLYATRLFLKRNVREMFAKLKTNELRQLWLEDQMERDMMKRGGGTSTTAGTGSRGMTGDNELNSS